MTHWNDLPLSNLNTYSTALCSCWEQTFFLSVFNSLRTLNLSPSLSCFHFGNFCWSWLCVGLLQIQKQNPFHLGQPRSWSQCQSIQWINNDHTAHMTASTVLPIIDPLTRLLMWPLFSEKVWKGEQKLHSKMFNESRQYYSRYCLPYSLCCVYLWLVLAMTFFQVQQI